MPAVAKHGSNAQQGWQFVTVEDVTRAARAVLNEAGLVAVYRIAADADPAAAYLDGALHVVLAATGEEMRLPMPWPIERSGPQARRAAFSYARKQSLLELLLVAEPDDPETAAEPAAEPAASQAQGKRRKAGAVHGPSPMSDAQKRMLWVTARQAGYGDPAELAAWAAGQLGVDLDASDPQQLLGSLTRQEASTLIDQLQQVQPATRSTEPDPPGDDPWQAHPVAPIPGGQADQ
jgi:hypothetical protein